MTFESIRYEVSDRIATITFDRPDRLNALSPAMIRELRQAYEQAEADPEVWILLVTGNGRAFCAGADVSEIPDDGRVVSEAPYLSTYEQWEAPQEGAPAPSTPLHRDSRRAASALTIACTSPCRSSGPVGSPEAC